MPAGTVFNSVEDTVAAALWIFGSAEHEIVYLVPPSMLSLAGTLDTVESAKRFIQRGGIMRGITSVSRVNVEEARMRLGIGEDLRHSDHPHKIFLFVGDQRYSVSSMNVGTDEYTLATPFVALWSEDPIYAAYLLASFESAWAQAVPAASRIQELMERGPE